MLKRAQERGDTLVEVLLAFAILSLVTVSAFAVMNRGVGEAQNALERSQVRTYATQQVELATYLRDQYTQALANGGNVSGYPANLWGAIKVRAAAATAVTAVDECSSVMGNSFYLTRNSVTNVIELNSFSSGNLVTPTIARPGSGMWVEPVASTSTGHAAYQKYIDLYVKSCWDPAAGSVKQTLSTVVRLYDK
jgi:type II secretory pathway pseudopilin PulG